MLNFFSSFQRVVFPDKIEEFVKVREYCKIDMFHKYAWKFPQIKQGLSGLYVKAPLVISIKDKSILLILDITDIENIKVKQIKLFEIPVLLRQNMKIQIPNIYNKKIEIWEKQSLKGSFPDDGDDGNTFIDMINGNLLLITHSETKYIFIVDMNCFYLINEAFGIPSDTASNDVKVFVDDLSRVLYLWPQSTLQFQSNEPYVVKLAYLKSADTIFVLYKDNSNSQARNVHAFRFDIVQGLISMYSVPWMKNINNFLFSSCDEIMLFNEDSGVLNAWDDKYQRENNIFMQAAILIKSNTNSSFSDYSKKTSMGASRPRTYITAWINYQY